MIFPAVAILALVASLVSPVLSAPVGIPNSKPLSHWVPAEGPPTSLGPHHHGTSTTLKHDGLAVDTAAHVHSHLTRTGAAGGAVESPITRVREGESPRLVRRKSIFSKMRGAFKKAGAGIKQVAQKVATGVQTAATKVGTFVKTEGPKVAKFGLKVYATQTSVASRFANFIPVVGKGVSKGLSGVSKVANYASGQIHADLGQKLEKGMSVMDRIQHPVGGVAGQVLNAVLKRDVDEEHLFERDLSELETRSFEDEASLEARSFEGEGIEARSFDDAYELDARSFEDVQELDARSWDFEEDEA